MSEIVIKLNGKDHSIPSGCRFGLFLERNGINPNVVACEWNLTILKRAKLADVILNDGDTLEVIQMIGGG